MTFYEALNKVYSIVESNNGSEGIDAISIWYIPDDSISTSLCFYAIEDLEGNLYASKSNGSLASQLYLKCLKIPTFEQLQGVDWRVKVFKSEVITYA